MKIGGPDNTRNKAAVRRRSKAGSEGSSGSAFSVSATDGESAPAQVGGSGPVNAVGALLSVQEVDDATTGKSGGVRRGIELLDLLDNIRVALLTGRIPEAQLQNLLNAMKRHREAISDPILEATINEIEVRAAVELAKFERMRDSE